MTRNPHRHREGTAKLDPDLVVDFAYVPWGEKSRVLGERLDLPARSTSLAYLTALARLGADRVALASIYHRDTTATFADFLAEAGVTTVHSVSADAPSDRALATWDGGHALGFLARTGYPADPAGARQAVRGGLYALNLPRNSCSVFVSRRETCIWEIPTRSAI
ncbi:hypothetical protein [Amycolatopsis sp. WAC 01375]|uniref:hypothetical protein n=1 Tax=Amycolatopsis sp. WAC 01375 TaxID=2203194 RepID=UPI001F3FE4D0|nr:hypothetical protein [Amycolatopsis sp. WAC 01375]